MTAFDFLKRFNMHSIENKSNVLIPASNSEIRRWFKNKSVIINGVAANWDDNMEKYAYKENFRYFKLHKENENVLSRKISKGVTQFIPSGSKGHFVFGKKDMYCISDFYWCKSLVLFPKGKMKTTLW